MYLNVIRCLCVIIDQLNFALHYIELHCLSTYAKISEGYCKQLNLDSSTFQ